MISSDKPMSVALDRTGVVLSSLCIVHCLLLPPFLVFLVVATPLMLPQWLQQNEAWHAPLLAVVAAVSGPVLYQAAKRDWRIGAMGIAGFVSLGSALLVPSEFFAEALTVLGATVLGIAHLFNLRARKL